MIGVFAYNEEHNIERLLKRILNEIPKDEKVLVVGGGTDKTEKIVKSLSKEHKNLDFIKEKGEGKINAFNLILDEIEKEDTVILIDGDNLPKEGSIKELKEELKKNENVAVSAKLIPKYSNFWCNLVWELHDKWSSKNPKLTQFFGVKGLKKFVKKIPEKIINDDAYLQYFIEKKGEKIEYCSGAETEIWDRKNQSLLDFFQKRRRIAAGYIQLKKGGKNTCIPISEHFRLVSDQIRNNPLQILQITLAVGLEILANLLAYVDIYLRKKVPYRWKS